MPQTKGKNSATASWDRVLCWVKDRIFWVENGKVFKGNKELAIRINLRNRMNTGDARVDLHHEGFRRSVHISQLIWMQHTLQLIPENFEIHHIDEDITNNNFSNLLCVHKLDHNKLHHSDSNTDYDYDTPF